MSTRFTQGEVADVREAHASPELPHDPERAQCGSSRSQIKDEVAQRRRNGTLLSGPMASATTSASTEPVLLSKPSTVAIRGASAEANRSSGSSSTIMNRRQEAIDEGPAAALGLTDTLVALVEEAPDGQVPAAQLCSRLYSKCPEAKAVIQRHKGLKGFIAALPLEGKVKFVPDQVCQPAFGRK